MNPWQLYDDLLDQIPAGITVTGYVSARCSIVATDAGGVGLASTLRGGPDCAADCADLVGRDLRDAAALVRSWDLRVASIGVAALNSWFNTTERLSAHPGIVFPSTSSFSRYAPSLSTRKVAVIGHFPGLDDYAADHDLIILERRPEDRDLPDSACEYVLADRELVFITATTIANKTLPRLLDLTADAHVVLVGPSTPFAPEVLGHRVAELGGAVVVDAVLARQLVHDECAAWPALSTFNAPLGTAQHSVFTITDPKENL